ncbi:zinc-dependent alcohol dehydrogenase [Haloplanus pelagicus]|jgi:L-iditol 2-dehydrogenase|uniref:zinc-dependent alcohol dehydrogenase n=1 Tax=Haloplanus pelagicus TaxID=2949995 RepID=UPI002041D69F|nr:zinc-binding dehydrogenase [Haloplanus sp. HW8-1]
METRVAYLDVGEITMETVELPELGPNDVLIDTQQASVCGSERYFYRGITVREEDEARGRPTEGGEYHGGEGRRHSYPMGPLGHEGGGTIEAVGSAVDEYLGGGAVSVGDRVGSLYYPTYTDSWVTDVSNVQPIPDGVDFEVGCLYEALACAAWAARRMDVKLGDTVAVNGVGFAGNIMLQGAIESGASQVIAVDVVDEKLSIAEEMGADVTIDASEEDPVERVDELTDDEGVDVAVEAVGGTGIGIKQALGMVAHNGVLALYGDNYEPIEEFCFHRFHEDGLEVQNLNAMHYTELQAVEYAREAYRAVERDVFDVQTILDNSARYSLDELPSVFEGETECADEQESLKTLIIP